MIYLKFQTLYTYLFSLIIGLQQMSGFLWTLLLGFYILI